MRVLGELWIFVKKVLLHELVVLLGIDLEKLWLRVWARTSRGLELLG